MSSPIVVPDGIEFEQFNDLCVYTITTYLSAAMDVFIDSVIARLREGLPTGVVYDFSKISLFRLRTFRFYDIGSLGLTVKGNEEIDALLREHREQKVSLATVTNSSLSGVVFRATAHGTQYPTKIFDNKAAALRWIDEMKKGI